MGNSIAYFEKGLKGSDGKSLNVQYALARMYEIKGNKQKAMETYWQILSLMKDEDPRIKRVIMHMTLLEN